MKNLILIFLLFFVSGFAFSQSGWFQQNSGTTVHLNSVYFIDSNTGFIVGDDGKLLKTTNGGDNWLVRPIGLNNHDYLLGVQFVNANTGYVAAKPIGLYEWGRGLKTTNGGTYWNIMQTGHIFKDVHCLFFINANTGFLGGFTRRVISSWPPTVLDFSITGKTINGGINWDTSYAYQTSNYFRTIFFVGSIGYASDGTSLIKTTNGGNNWSQTNPSIQQVIALFFTSASTGHAVGNNGMYHKTIAGGYPWLSRQITAGTLNSIHFTSPDTGYVVGSGGQIHKTTNAGQNWYRQYYTTFPYALHSIHFINNNTGFAVGVNGKILKTTTGGVSGIKILSNEIPDNYNLYQNYPNPFNPSTAIRFDIPKYSYTKIIVSDALGRKIETLINEELRAGSYEVNFNGSNYPSGVYFYKLQADKFIDVKKMLLVK